MKTVETIKQVYDLINLYKECQMAMLGISIEIYECMSELMESTSNKDILEEIGDELVNIGIWK